MATVWWKPNPKFLIVYIRHMITVYVALKSELE